MLLRRQKECLAPFRRRANVGKNRGFALVITVSLMVLLALLAVGLLSLSTISLRASSTEVAASEARANARLALAIALGELQRAMGPDQRISANGSILAAASNSTMAHPHWTGVWDSWKAEDRDSVDGFSRHQSVEGPRMGGMHPTYEEGRRDHFRSWLVSLAPEARKDLTSAANLNLEATASPRADSTAVRLVGEGTLGGVAVDGPQDHVAARLLKADTGRFAWWVGDESQKARLMDDPYLDDEADSVAEKVFRHQAPGATGTARIEGLENLADNARLAALPSLLTLDLAEGAEGRPSRAFHDLTPFSYQVLSDVREGGLKRDLSVLLERPIREGRNGLPTETDDDFMLYKFNTKDQWASTPGQEQVPIHDLTAYYQMYDSSRDAWNQGVIYDSGLLGNRMQVSAPDFGTKSDISQYLRQYTALYRQPIPVKVQFLLSLSAEAITPAPRPSRQDPDPDTHKLHLGISPALTLWNPTNLPMKMNFGDPHRYAWMFRLLNMPINVRWNKNSGEYESRDGMHMTWLTQQSGSFKANVYSLYLSGTRPITLEPGEVKVLSLPYRPGNMNFSKTDNFVERHEVAEGWDPTAFLEMHRSDRNNNPEHVKDNCLTFKASDRISAEITADNTEIFTGHAMAWLMIQTTYQRHGGLGTWHFRHFHQMSRVGQGTSTAAFNQALMTRGFPQRSRGGITIPARSGSEIIARSSRDEAFPFLQVAMMAGCETAEEANGGAFSGRKFVSRPFLHSSPLSPAYLDRDDLASFYHHGWNWWVEEINSIFEANVQVTPENQGFYGGGYTPENGTTHVIQQEIPVAPPISIAALSHARLGGYSIAYEACAGEGDGTDGSGYQGLINPWEGQSYHHVSVTGQGGLFPHTLQAIGNSYAHPHIPADKAHTTWTRHFSEDAGTKQITLADHSYLANKALWDEYFFSSITPQPSAVEAFGGGRDRSADEVARAFFFDNEPLPNRRMTAYMAGLDERTLDGLLGDSVRWRNGLADKIAAHLMVEGPFNINSTSVEAWKVLLSSLKGKPVAFLDRRGRGELGGSTPEGTPVAGVSLPGGEPFEGSPSEPADPDQWQGWRELSDEEIDQLAEAIVRQVKRRGPFLSLSEFVNRRLDGSDAELAAKGALQAALDDREVEINEGFRDPVREISGAGAGGIDPVFREAAEGPVAYGSMAYVDQADILRHLAAQLTPRGDTFVIRTYGDSLDAAGQVRARAWCEAVVQRLPEYVDPTDAAHLATAELTSEANRSFGRKLRLVSFRWLSPSEV